MRLNAFFKELEKKMVNAIKNDFKEMLHFIGDERIYAVCFVTDSEARTTFFVANTYEYIEKRDQEYIEKGWESAYDELKWDPSDWGYGNSHFQSDASMSVASYLSEKREDIEEEIFDGFEEKLHTTMISVLDNLHNEKVFCQNKDDITVFISMSDDERTEEVENYSARSLNSEKVYNEFLKRFDNII
ncbi:DUF4303 domain-containing protein [Lysinibacillus sp. CTST325]